MNNFLNLNSFTANMNDNNLNINDENNNSNTSTTSSIDSNTNGSNSFQYLNCKCCARTIETNDIYIEFGEYLYHKQCYSCKKCDKQFYDTGVQPFKDNDGHLFCQEDFIK
jgi:hypothetical protein